jgi:hypothetical protein
MKMKMKNFKNLNCVILEKEDANSILELINLVQPKIPWSHDYLEWQFFKCPDGPAIIYGIKNLEGKLLAIYCAVAKKIQFYNKEIKGRMIQDVMTHPDYRGRGFLHLLSNICLGDLKKKTEFGYTFPNEKSENSFRRNNWTELCSIPIRIKSLKKNLEFRPKLEITNLDGNFAKNISSIWENSGIKIGVKRDAQFLNWRYNKPSAKYYKFILNLNEGFLILKIFNERNKNFLHICDLVVREDKKQIILDALQFSEYFGKINNCKFITSWSSKNHFYSEYYDNLNMNIIPISRYGFVYFNNRFKNFKNSEMWYLSQGDSDVY